MAEAVDSVIDEIGGALALREEAELAAASRARDELSAIDPIDVPATFLDVESLGAGLKASGWSQGRAIERLVAVAGDMDAPYDAVFKAIGMIDDRIEKALRYSGRLATMTVSKEQRDEDGSVTRAEMSAVTTTQEHLSRIKELQEGLNTRRVVDSRDVTAREEPSDE